MALPAAPWRLVDKSEHEIPYWEIRAPGKDGACSYQHGGFSFTVCTTLENARLIAAAPDLLAALQMLVADFADYPASERPCLAFDKARAALAKATGAA